MHMAFFFFCVLLPTTGKSDKAGLRTQPNLMAPMTVMTQVFHRRQLCAFQKQRWTVYFCPPSDTLRLAGAHDKWRWITVQGLGQLILPSLMSNARFNWFPEYQSSWTLKRTTRMLWWHLEQPSPAHITSHWNGMEITGEDGRMSVFQHGNHGTGQRAIEFWSAHLVCNLSICNWDDWDLLTVIYTHHTYRGPTSTGFGESVRVHIEERYSMALVRRCKMEKFPFPLCITCFVGHRGAWHVRVQFFFVV